MRRLLPAALPDPKLRRTARGVEVVESCDSLLGRHGPPNTPGPHRGVDLIHDAERGRTPDIGRIDRGQRHPSTIAARVPRHGQHEPPLPIEEMRPGTI